MMRGKGYANGSGVALSEEEAVLGICDVFKGV